MRRVESAYSSFSSTLLRSYLHTSPRRRLAQPEPKSDKERAKLGLPLREPWFEVKPFDEKKKNFVLRLKEILQAQPKQKMEVASLGQLRQELDVVRQGKQRKIATYVRRFPSAYTLHSFYTPNNKKKTWCGFSADAQKLLAEEDLLFQASEALQVQKLRKLLMISMKNRLPFSSVNRVRESLGLPFDFKESLVNKHSDIFFLKERKGYLYLELKEWDDSLAISALEMQMQAAGAGKTSTKCKKQRMGKMAVNAEENGAGGLCGMAHEQSVDSRGDADFKEDGEGQEKLFLAEDKAKLCLAEDKGNAQREEEFEEEVIPSGEMISSKAQSSLFEEEEGAEEEGQVHEAAAASHELPSLSMKETSVTNECQEDKVSSLDACGTNLDGVGVRDCHPEWEMLQTASNLQENISSVYLSGKEATNVHPSERESETLIESCHGTTQKNSAFLPFPWKSKRGKQPNVQRAAEIEAFQSAPYISPYRNSRELELPARSVATEKFIVAVLHEFLSLTLEKRAMLQQLELLQRPYRLPGNLSIFLLKYDGIFYVVHGRSKSHVFLKEAYKESILLEKDPLVLWQERFVELAFSTEKKEKTKESPQQEVSV